jgi:hypothetical protein
MTQAFTTYAFTATGAITARAYPDRLAEVINVKDYGAVGNGVTDDTAAIQAALDAAFGSVASPHGYTNRFLNKPVVFPAGNYIVTDTLNIKWVIGASIRGSGAGTTKITYTGAIAGGATYTPLFQTDGFKFCHVSDIAFIMTGGNALADKTVAFSYDWDQQGGDPSEVGGSQVTFTNCKFAGATYGLLIGLSQFQCDTATLINCEVDDCYYGVNAVNGNAICSGMFGGSVTNCHAGIYMAAGTMETICGVSFAGNTDDGNVSGDIVSLREYPMFIVGCYSTSPRFAFFGAGEHFIAGCRHEASTSGPFIAMTFPVAVIIESCHSEKGYLQGHTGGVSAFYLNDFVMDTIDWTHLSGQICEWITKTPMTFAQLPTTTTWFNQGLTVNITDAATAVWGANVTTGGGSDNVSIRWNGSNWTVVGK